MKNYNLANTEFNLEDGECYVIQLKEEAIGNPNEFRILYLEQFAANLGSLCNPKYATLYTSREETERYIPFAKTLGTLMGVVQIKDVLDPYYRLRAYECQLTVAKFWDGIYDEPFAANHGMCCEGGIAEYKYHMIDEYEEFKKKFNELKIDTINNCHKVIMDLMQTKYE